MYKLIHEVPNDKASNADDVKTFEDESTTKRGGDGDVLFTRLQRYFTLISNPLK